MARDYKYRASSKKKQALQPKIAWWKWGLSIILIALFIFFLVFLRNTAPETKAKKQSFDTAIKKKKTPQQSQAKVSNNKPEEPRFDFYTILPETEIVVPDYEINTRSREEKFGKRKGSKYLIQAGSFRNFAEADKLRARLALMGIESRIEKAKIGNVVWNRVKVGPYSRSSSVAIIKKRLRNKGIDVIVTELKS